MDINKLLYICFFTCSFIFLFLTVFADIDNKQLFQLTVDQQKCKRFEISKYSEYERCITRLSRRRRNVEARKQMRRDYFGNPCTSYKFLDQTNRSVNNVIDRLHDQAMCDRNLRKRWYRFSGQYGQAMPTSCVDENSCGTHSPIWLHGHHPAKIGEAIDAEVCASLAGHCCSRRWYIKIANCGDFFTYLLTDTPGCYMAYCAGSEVACPDGTSSKSGFSPGCTSEFPALEGEVKLTLNEHNPSLTFNCDYEGKIAKGSYLEAEWYVLGGKTSFYTHGDNERAPVWVDSMFERRRSSLVEGYWSGRLGSTIYCRMKAKWKNDTGVYSPSIESNKFFAGIKVLNPLVNITEESDEGYIELQSTVPIICLPQFSDACKLTLELAYDANYMGEECSAGKMRQVVFGDCYVEFTPENWKQVQRIKVKAVRDFYSDGNQVMKVDFRPIYSTLVSEMWSEYQLPSVEIMASDRPTKICSSIGDPHYTTFDGHIYHVYMEGEFVLYKNTKFPIQINTRLEKCEKIVTCNCGVAVLVADDVIVIDRCQKRKRNLAYGGSFPEGWNTIHRHALEQGDSFTRGLKLYEHDEGRRFTIHMPTGAFVDFKVGDGWVNIFLQASSDDWRNTLGLCGTFDGDVENDFTLPDGRSRIATEMHAACAGSEAVCKFADAWRVHDAESMFGETVTVDDRSRRSLTPTKYCQCHEINSNATDTASQGEIVCNYDMDVQNCADELEDDLDEEDRIDKTDSIMIHKSDSLHSNGKNQRNYRNKRFVSEGKLKFKTKRSIREGKSANTDEEKELRSQNWKKKSDSKDIDKKRKLNTENNKLFSRKQKERKKLLQGNDFYLRNKENNNTKRKKKKVPTATLR